MEIEEKLRKSLLKVAVKGQEKYVHELLALLLTSLVFQVRRQTYRRRVQRRLMEVCFPAATSTTSR